MQTIVKLITTIFLLGSTLPGFAQDIKWSIPKKVKGRVVYTNILGGYKGNSYLIRFDKKNKQTFIIEKYNSDLRIIDQHEFKIDKDRNVDKVILLNGKTYVFYSFYDKDDKVYKLYCNLFDDKLTPLIKDRFIAATSIRSSDTKIFKIEKDFYTRRLLLFYPKQIINNIVEFNVMVLSDELKTLHNSNVSLNTDKDFLLEELYLAENTVGIVFSEDYAERSRDQNLRFSFLYFDLKESEKRIISLYNDTIRFNNVALNYDRLNNLFVITGFYSGLKDDGQKGIGVARVYHKEDRAEISYMVFSKGMVMHIMGKAKTYDYIFSYQPKKIVLRSDGGIIFISEYFDVQRELYTDYYNINHSYIKYFYKYSDVIVFSLEPDGSLDWYKILRKEQVTMNDEGYYSSFFAGVKKDKIIMMYNDLSRSKWNLVSDQLDPNGYIENETLVNENSFDGYLIPKLGEQISSNDILIPGFSKRKGFILLKVKI